MLAASIAIALAFWGPPPCETRVDVMQLEPTVAGIAWVYGDGTCRVAIASGEWKFWTLCATVVHEYGHLHGLPHSDDPLDPMFPMLHRPADACRGKRPANYPRGAVIELAP